METLLTKDELDLLEKNGVNFVCKECVYIGRGVTLEKNATIYPNNHIYGESVVRSGAVIEPDCIICDSEINENATVTKSVLKKAVVGRGATVGPFAYLRPGTKVGDNCRVGDFVEIKNSQIGDGTKIAHLTYVGDAEIGRNCNLGCGIVFANYDGKNKYKTVIGNDCFLGSNCNFIAPLNVGDNCFIAAGTTVTKDVADGKFVIGRARQEENQQLAAKYIRPKK